MHEPLSNAVRHDAEQHRFALDIDGETVFTEYRLAPGTISFLHTLTPPSLRGRGLAGAVVKVALDYARAEKLKVVPLCWYVGEYMDTHPEYQDLRVQRPA
jgi:predicted GNAT family acetyltransferase